MNTQLLTSTNSKYIRTTDKRYRFSVPFKVDTNQVGLHLQAHSTHLHNNGISVGDLVVQCCVGVDHTGVLVDHKRVNGYGHTVSISYFNDVIENVIVDPSVLISSHHCLDYGSLEEHVQRNG